MGWCVGGDGGLNSFRCWRRRGSRKKRGYRAEVDKKPNEDDESNGQDNLSNNNQKTRNNNDSNNTKENDGKSQSICESADKGRQRPLVNKKNKNIRQE
ncbi:hypothetical protein BP00DRAFT_429892 [Aspergillus indologenus CBS 114.80]|uniref:Uncharacterized protein n=1 Tax=Aspergillus indologenus CBS 114.80 TaxID=1450541 RepID=A0A2V5HR32_9EURO|nr:hypothetical protein BP00DRAFT_429892 [Aspergillus indologenus CBS 114.80]